MNSTVKSETEKAFLIEMFTLEGNITFWVPKSQVKSTNEKNIEVASWLSKNAYEAYCKKFMVSPIIATSSISKFIKSN